MFCANVNVEPTDTSVGVNLKVSGDTRYVKVVFDVAPESATNAVKVAVLTPAAVVGRPVRRNVEDPAASIVTPSGSVELVIVTARPESALAVYTRFDV
jgi:predicted transcriptional regulator